MRVIFQTTAGPLSGRRFPLQSGDRVRVGRAEAADICFADDPALEDAHFEIQCLEHSCVVRGLHAGAALAVNDQLVTEAVLSHEDVVAAGNSRLQVLFPATHRPVSPSGSDASEEQDDKEPEKTTQEICELAELGGDVKELPLPDEQPDSFGARLVEMERYSDAVYFLATRLPKRDAVFWGFHSLETLFGGEQSEHQLAILESTRKWLMDPTDGHRRAAMGLAEEAELRDVASCIAAGAFWSEGSMAPEGMADVDPGPTLTAKMIGGALVMAATDGDVTEIDKRYRSILDLGIKIATRELITDQVLGLLTESESTP